MLDLGTFDRAERATGGFDTTVWHLERGGRQFALRAVRANQLTTLQRELVALGAARGGGVPVPRVYALGTFEARPSLLMEWSPGRPLLDELRARPGQLLTLGVRFGRQHAALHRVAAPASLRANWIAWAGPLEPGLAARLEQLAPIEPRLLHMDYHPLNILVHASRISSVLDWTNAHGGDPRADFARTVTILRLSPPLGGLAERAMRLALELAWRYGYGARHTRDDLAPFYAWAGAAMQHDLASRFSAAQLAHVRRWTAAWSVAVRRSRPPPSDFD
jgi:aminoglycoside phosphotransferase (APT) family kinase protein